MLERMLASFFSGSLLALAGSCIQATTHNPLASTATLGISGIAVAIVLISQSLVVLFPAFFSSIEVPGLTLLFLVLSVMALAFQNWQGHLPKRFGRELEIQHQGPLLLGITFNLAIGSLFALCQFIFLSLNWEFPSDLWFGTFKFAHFQALFPLGLLLTIAMAWSWRASGDLELMSYGPDLSMNVGISWRPRMAQALLLAMAAEALVCLHFGVFGLASLIFPLFWRQFSFFSRDIKRELSFGPVASGGVMMGLDLFCYQFPISGSEIPVGLLVMLVGSVGLIFGLWKTHLAKKEQAGQSE